MGDDDDGGGPDPDPTNPGCGDDCPDPDPGDGDGPNCVDRPFSPNCPPDCEAYPTDPRCGDSDVCDCMPTGPGEGCPEPLPPGCENPDPYGSGSGIQSGEGVLCEYYRVSDGSWQLAPDNPEECSEPSSKPPPPDAGQPFANLFLSPESSRSCPDKSTAAVALAGL